MKSLNLQQVNKAKQAGFTIIELIVVILLLGILTATALPRFLDISDDAHGAVVDAVEGSLRTGIALYRAGWIAGGETLDVALSTYGAGNLFPDDNATGYPADAVDGAIAADAVDCLAVFNGLLDLGGITAAGAASPDVGAPSETAIEAAAAGGADFVATPDLAASPTGCHFYYTGQFNSGGDGTPGNEPVRTIRLLTYTLATGAIAETTASLDQN